MQGINNRPIQIIIEKNFSLSHC